MPRHLFRACILTAASVAALGVYALGQPGPAAAPRSPAASPGLVQDSLDDDAAAAGETSMARTVPPAVYVPAPDVDRDPIGDLAAATPAYEQPSPEVYDARAPAHRHPGPPHRRLHRIRHRTAPAVAAVPALAGAPATHVAPALVIKPPHRLHIIVEPRRRLALQTPEPDATTATLPDVETAPSAADQSAQLAALEQAVASDGAAAQMRLSPGLAAGRGGEVSVILPADAVTDLEAKAEAAGLDPVQGPMTVTVTLSGQGYDIDPAPARTSRLRSGAPASFRWRITPYAGAAGALSAEIEASAPIGGEVQPLSLGTITAELPMLAENQPSTAPPAQAQPPLGERLRADLSQLRLHDLAIPGRPTLEVPGLGDVPSEDVVAGGLALLALLFLRALLRDAGDRALRRRRIEAFEGGYYGDGAL